MTCVMKIFRDHYINFYVIKTVLSYLHHSQYTSMISVGNLRLINRLLCFHFTFILGKDKIIFSLLTIQIHYGHLC